MSELLSKFSLEAAKFNAQVLAAALLVWALVLGCAISSILSQRLTPKQRIFWIAMVVFLPIIGLLAYLPFSFRKEELPHIFQISRPRLNRPGEKGRLP